MAAIPGVGPWTGGIATGFNQILDTASSLCWDSNTVAVGARVFLQECNHVTPTQAFNFITLPDQSVVLTAAVNAEKTLCVELGDKNALSLQECRNGFSKQQFNLNDSSASLHDDPTVCFAHNTGNVLAPVACETKAPTTIVPVTTAPRYMPAHQALPLRFTEGDFCLESTNATAEVGDVVVGPCNGSPAQNWYWHWGQIRNVESGLCLDSPNADSYDTEPRPVSASACPVMSITQFWLKTPENTLVNGASTNCIHIVNATTIQLGTDYCGANDILTGSKTFAGVDSFTADMGEPECTTPRARKDFRDLTSEEQNAFFTGLDILFNTPSLVGRKNRYHDFVALHGAGSRWFHGTPYFLPWHRYYTALLEKDLQIVLQNSTFAYPFWNWGTDASTWNRVETGILTPEWFGTTGNGNEEGCVVDGFSKGRWIPNEGRSNCLIRGYYPDADDESVSLYTEDYMLLALQVNPWTSENYTNYDGFREILEALPHNNFHMSVAGDNYNSHMGSTQLSVNDPIFFMHHNNMDRHWQYFQNAHPALANSFDGQASYPPWSSNMVNVTHSDLLIGFNVPVSKAIGVRKGVLCHTYQPYSKSIASVAIQHSQLARRASIRRRQSTTGNDLLQALDPAVAGKVIQDEIAMKSDSAQPVDKAHLPVPKRTIPTKMTDAFLDRMQSLLHVNKNRIRELEGAALRILEKLRAQTDKVMADKFGKDITNVTFEQHAVAVKVAVAEIALKKE
ncbi:hypothetical protein HDU67_008978 [Dinochytrium kinnereticum]|nr:hypothetical protein HDU67_008978 [Dinochytrium kinnereticum]